MLAISTTNEDDLLATWSQKKTKKLGRAQKLGRGDAYAAETKFGMQQRSGEYFAPNPVLSFFGMDFALKFED